MRSPANDIIVVNNANIYNTTNASAQFTEKKLMTRRSIVRFYITLKQAAYTSRDPCRPNRSVRAAVFSVLRSER